MELLINFYTLNVKKGIIMKLKLMAMAMTGALLWCGMSTTAHAAVKKSAPRPAYYPVTRVIDGDTFEVKIGGKTETVRALGIDTPETVDPRKTVQCFGKEASNKTKELLLGKKVRLLGDSTQSNRDKYNRLLRYVYLPNGIFFNQWMIQTGYAHEYTYIVPYKFQKKFKDVEKKARIGEKGLWSPTECATPKPKPQTSTMGPSSSATPESPVNPPSQAQSSSSAHTWYTSSYHTATFYYCDNDDEWRGLAPIYLEWFSSEEELLKKYPARVLHKPC